MSKSRLAVAIVLAFFYIVGCTLIGLLTGMAFGFGASLMMMGKMGNQLLGTLCGFFFYIGFPVGGFALGVFYTVSVLKNDRT